MGTVLKIAGHPFDFSKNVYLMGILNVTPDSFSDGGHYQSPERALERALQMQEEGADLIDIGGESTRPGAEPVDAEEELCRMVPAIKILRKNLSIPISIDTRKGVVAERALQEGGSMVNDISALADPHMIKVIVKYDVPVILMHMRGEPQTMQQQIHYTDVMREVRSYLKGRVEFAIQQGISKDQILIDPGIGFGKRVEDNQEIIRRLSELQSLGYPIAFGSSRKSFVRKIYGEEKEQMVKGSVETALEAVRNGAKLLRVHDVDATRRALNGLDIPRL